MPYSLKHAATATGKSKPTILRAIQSGKISAEKDVQGEWQIEPAELHRVYPPVSERTVPDETAWNDTQQGEVAAYLASHEVTKLPARFVAHVAGALSLDEEKRRINAMKIDKGPTGRFLHETFVQRMMKE
jgi:hypothetical protein